MVGASTILTVDLERELAQQPDYIRARFLAPERKREFLDSMIRSKLLVQAARAEGLDEDPEVRSAVDKLLIQALLQRRLAAAAIDLEEVKAYYAEHEAEFMRPDRVRLSQVFFASRRADRTREQVKLEAERALAQLQALKPDAQGPAFAALARKRSDHDASRALDGDLGLRSAAELEQQYGAPVAEAGFGLKAAGALSQVVPTDQGLHLLLLREREPGVRPSLEAVRPIIESRLKAEKRAKALDVLLAQLRAGTRVEVDAAQLAAAAVQAPAGPLLGDERPPASP